MRSVMPLAEKEKETERLKAQLEAKEKGPYHCRNSRPLPPKKTR